MISFSLCSLSWLISWVWESVIFWIRSWKFLNSSSAISFFIWSRDLIGVLPDSPDGHPPVFRVLLNQFDEFFSAFLGQGRDGKPDHFAVIIGIDVPSRSFEAPFQYPKGPERSQGLISRVLESEAETLATWFKGTRTSVILDLDIFHQRRGGPAGPDRWKNPVWWPQSAFFILVSVSFKIWFASAICPRF